MHKGKWCFCPPNIAKTWTLSSPHGREMLRIAFCPLWTTWEWFCHICLWPFSQLLSGSSRWSLRWGLTCWPMSAVFSVPVPVLVGPSVLLCVRMRMGTLPTTAWRESNPMSTEPGESGPCPQWAYGSWGEVSVNSTYTSFGGKANTK